MLTRLSSGEDVVPNSDSDHAHVVPNSDSDYAYVVPNSDSDHKCALIPFGNGNYIRFKWIREQ